MRPEEFTARAVAVPFVDHGRDWTGWDCWGLVRLYYREVLGIDLPLNDVGYATAGETVEDRRIIDRMIDQDRIAMWERVDSFLPGHVLLIRMAGRPIHIGVMVNIRQFIHAEKKLGTIVERVSSPLWSRRIEGVYRHAAS